MALATFMFALSVAIAFLVICFWFPIYWTNRFQIVDRNEKAEIEDAYRRTVAQILGGAAIALTFAWTWMKDHETLELTRIQAANQQFGTATTLISNNNVTASAAAIYSMENLVAARSDYYTPVVNTLTSLIKQKRPMPGLDEVRPTAIPIDVQAAVYVLGRMRRQNGPLEMKDLYLVSADFRSLKEFQGADFSGSVMFRVNFSSSNLSGALFAGTEMSDWESFGRSKWSKDVNREWQTSKAWERVQYVALFDWATLTNSTFRNMSVSGASFEHADLSGASFIGVDLSRADFQNAKNLANAKFVDCCYDDENAPVGLQSVLKALKSPCPSIGR